MNPNIISNIFTSTPSIKFCNLFNGLSPLWDYTLHQHPYMELIYRKRGFGQTDLLEGTQNFIFFDTIVYPVGCWHQDKFEASAENEAYCLWLDIPCVPLDEPLQVQDHNGKLEFLFRCIYEEYQKPSSSLELLSLLTRTLLTQIVLFTEESEPSVIERIIQYLNIHMTNKITLDDLANDFFISKSYLVKRFKQETGKTIIEYLNSVRIETAKMLLITTSKTVEEIAYTVGYDSPKYFSRIFKAFVGMSPANFYKKNKLYPKGKGDA